MSENIKTRGQQVRDMIKESVQTAKFCALQEEEALVKELIEKEIKRIKEELQNFKYDKDVPVPEFDIDLGDRELFFETRQKLQSEGFEYQHSQGTYHIFLAED